MTKRVVYLTSAVLLIGVGLTAKVLGTGERLPAWPLAALVALIIVGMFVVASLPSFRVDPQPELGD